MPVLVLHEGKGSVWATQQCTYLTQHKNETKKLKLTKTPTPVCIENIQKSSWHMCNVAFIQNIFLSFSIALCKLSAIYLQSSIIKWSTVTPLEFGQHTEAEFTWVLWVVGHCVHFVCWLPHVIGRSLLTHSALHTTGATHMRQNTKLGRVMQSQTVVDKCQPGATRFTRITRQNNNYHLAII